jgi:beta-glucosidase
MTGFPFADRPRLWGVAVSHYQVEGDDPCDWTDWEAMGRTRGEPCGRAVGAWTRYETDAFLAREAGANAFRFSVSWSRVEPRRGCYDDAALSRYHDLVDELVRLGIEPVATLFHYTHPRWFHSDTPWTSTESVNAFREFASRTAEALGPRVRLWTILNEPLVFILGGFLDAQIPPGLARGDDAARALANLLTAHREAAWAIREKNPSAVMSVAHNMMGFTPERAGWPLDRWIAKRANGLYNLGLVEAFATGRWNFLLPPFSRFRGRCEGLEKTLDVFGVNYYSRLHLRCPGRERFLADFGYRDPAGRGFTDNGWEIAPDGLTPLLEAAAQSGRPLIVTENGIADAADRLRPSYLREHFESMNSPSREATRVHGYFHWSLLDNYEWLDGYGPKFGLYEVDRETMARRPRPSVDTFGELGREFLESPATVGGRT